MLTPPGEGVQAHPPPSTSSHWFERGVFGLYTFAKRDIEASDRDERCKLVGTCNLCDPPKRISGRKHVTSNFRKHAKTCHADDFQEVERGRTYNRSKSLSSSFDKTVTVQDMKHQLHDIIRTLVKSPCDVTTSDCRNSPSTPRVQGQISVAEVLDPASSAESTPRPDSSPVKREPEEENCADGCTTSMNSRKRKSSLEGEEWIRKKVRQIREDFVFLDRGFRKLMEEGVNERNMETLVMANTLRKASEIKKQEVDELELMLSSPN